MCSSFHHWRCQVYNPAAFFVLVEKSGRWRMLASCGSGAHNTHYTTPRGRNCQQLGHRVTNKWYSGAISAIIVSSSVKGERVADGCARQSVSMPSPMLAALKREAKKRDLTVSQVIREKIREAQPQPTPPATPGRRLPGAVSGLQAMAGKAGWKSWPDSRCVSVRLET